MLHGLSPKMISAGCRSANWEVESTSFYSHTYSVRVFISISWSWGKGTYSALTPGYSTNTPMACAPRHLQRHGTLEPDSVRKRCGDASRSDAHALLPPRADFRAVP